MQEYPSPLSAIEDYLVKIGKEIHYISIDANHDKVQRALEGKNSKWKGYFIVWSSCDAKARLYILDNIPVSLGSPRLGVISTYEIDDCEGHWRFGRCVYSKNMKRYQEHQDLEQSLKALKYEALNKEKFDQIVSHLCVELKAKKP